MSGLLFQHNYTAKNTSVYQLVRDFEMKYNSVFQKVKTDWLPTIREFIREETGLKIYQKVAGTKIHKDTSVTFYFVTDRESKFIKLIDENYPDLNFDEYSAFNKLYKEMEISKRYFNENSVKPTESFYILSNFLQEYFKKYDLEKLMNTLFRKSGRTADIWGTYFHNDSRIEIYYVPLILFCQINNLPLEHAILSTLVHEMAHYYHHIGKDKDSVSWTNMGITDKRIVEGMAEYYTWLFIEIFKPQHAEMEKTYNCMFNCLSEEYTIFKKWTPIYSKEAIKSALLGTRKKSITNYEDFQKLLADVKKIMH